MNRRRVARFLRLSFFPPCVACLFSEVLCFGGFNMRTRSRVAGGGSVSRSGPMNALRLLFKIG